MLLRGPSAPSSPPLSAPQVSHLLKAVGAGVTGGEWTQPPTASLAGSGRGCRARDPPYHPPCAEWLVQWHSPTLLSQLFSLQAPLKTLLQLTIMPIINGKHRCCPQAAGLRAGHGGARLHRLSPSLQRGLKQGCRSHCRRAWTSPGRWSPTMRYGMGTVWASAAGTGTVSHQPRAHPLPPAGIPHGGSRPPLLQGATGGD